MAQFGIEATQLSAPQGAGASPVAPVTAGLLDNGVGGALGNIVNIFAKGIESNQKAEAEALKKSVVSSYVKGQQKINEAARSGQMTPSEAKMRSRAHFGEFASGYSEYISDIEGAAKALRGNTELGDVEDEVKAGQDLMKAAKTAAQSAGFTFVPGMSAAQEQSQIDAHQASVRADAEMSRLLRNNAEKRAQGTYDQGVADREAKDLSLRLITTIADTNFTASYDYAQSLSQAVKAGTIKQEDAALEWNRKMGTINAQIQSAAGLNPELAGPYRTLFADLQGLGDKLLDPKMQAENLDNEIKLITNKAKLVLLQKPKIATIVAASALMGQNATIALQSAAPVTEAITSIFSESVDSPTPKAQIIGNSEVEKPAFDFTSQSLKSFNRGDFKGNEKASVEMKNTVDNILQQISDTVNRRGADPKTLVEASKFLASPEFGEYASKNKIDAEAQRGAIKATELLFKNSVIGAVDKAIQRSVNVPIFKSGAAPFDKGETVNTTFDPKKLKIVFNGSGISFALENSSRNIPQARMEQEVIKSLSDPQKAINQLIHMGAHLEGSVDYAKYWEANKHLIVPSFFQAPVKKPEEQPEGGAYKNEPAMKKEATLNVQPDNTAAGAHRVSQDIIAIKEELKKTKNPTAIRILEEELRKLGAQ